MSVEIPVAALEREPLQDHCGIVAAYCPTEIPFFVTGLAGLVKLQTRGYDGAGVFALNQAGAVLTHKGEGMISEVFSREAIASLKDWPASLWLLQTRYGTDGDTSLENIQPIIRQTVTSKTFAVIHNGQFSQPSPNGVSDTVRFAEELAADPEPAWETKLLKYQDEKTGAWSLAIATDDGLFLLRDNFGIRPLVFGSKTDALSGATVYCAASETAALSAMGISHHFEVPPGAVIQIGADGLKFLRRGNFDIYSMRPCIFENVYLENGKSAIHRARTVAHLPEERTVEDFRRQTGVNLAHEERPGFIQEVDLAIGIPGTGITGGRAYAEALGLPYIQAISDRKPQEADARTFMTPNIDDIPDKISRHFYFESNYLEGMRLVLIDDSVVRGNITKGIIKLLKAPVDQGGYGVREVHIRVLCPPIDKPCHLGINTRKRKELIAARHGNNDEAMTERELKQKIAELTEHIRVEIGAESLYYLSSAGLREAGGNGKFCLGCMVGHHPPIDKQGVIYARK